MKPLGMSQSLTYNLIKGYEQRIIYIVVYCEQSASWRKIMVELRDTIKEIACKNCTELNQVKMKETTVGVLVKNEELSSEFDKILLSPEKKKVKTYTMACIGCRVLRDKQIATRFIKGRRFKQV